jgi:hypothetical protein
MQQHSWLQGKATLVTTVLSSQREHSPANASIAIIVANFILQAACALSIAISLESSCTAGSSVNGETARTCLCRTFFAMSTGAMSCSR